MSLMPIDKYYPCTKSASCAGHLACHRHTEVVCQNTDKRGNEGPVIHEECAIMTSACNPLGAAQVDVNCVTLVFDQACSCQQGLRVIGTELH